MPGRGRLAKPAVWLPAANSSSISIAMICSGRGNSKFKSRPCARIRNAAPHMAIFASIRWGGPRLKRRSKARAHMRATLFPWILSDRWWNTDAPLLRRTVTDAVGPWTDLRWSQDWEYDGRVGALGTRLVHCQEFVCDERHHAGVRQTSPADWLTPERLLSRKRFLTLMLGHAERAGVSPDSVERKHFTRWVFATARQCAAAGLSKDARECMELAERSAGDCAEARRGFRMFQSLCAVMGSKRAGGVLRMAEKWKKPGALTAEQSFARDLK